MQPPLSPDAMPQRIAAILALIAFAMCMVIGGLQADNPFTTTVTRSLIAMLGTFVIGLVLGAMGQKMLSDSVKAVADGKLAKVSQEKSEPDGR